MDALLEKTLADLEWHTLETHVASLLRGPSGLDFRLLLASSFEETERSLAETAEALMLLREGEPLPLDSVRDIEQSLLRVERHGDLDIASVHDVRLTLQAARVLRRFLSARKARTPALFAACPIDPSLDRLADTLSRALDPDGTLADHASAELKRLRTETRNLRAHLIARLEELIHKQHELLSDRFYTLRDGRYVVPVRSDAHERVHGIVHGASASGATIFVEPRALVTQGNRLKLAEAEQEREEQRILAALSARDTRRVCQRARGLSTRSCTPTSSNASARLAQQFGLHVARAHARAAPEAARGQAPGALFDGADVVANDVDAEAGQRARRSAVRTRAARPWLSSCSGLSALMVRAGLFLPCRRGKQRGFFDAVLSDIGDEQSLAKSLSTFSAHVDHIRHDPRGGRPRLARAARRAGGQHRSRGGRGARMRRRRAAV